MKDGGGETNLRRKGARESERRATGENEESDGARRKGRQ